MLHLVNLDTNVYSLVMLILMLLKCIRRTSESQHISISVNVKIYQILIFYVQDSPVNLSVNLAHKKVSMI